ncbi:MAG: uroporphyrinogen decarboxylase family protein, partial [Spirochaetota bacterium]
MEGKNISRKEQVKRAIFRQSPAYVPMLFFNKDKEQSDIIMIEVVRHFMGSNKDTSEWGFVWEKYDETMGQPAEVLIKHWDALDQLAIPDPRDAGRYKEVESTMELYGRDRYYLASLVLTGFTVMTFLRGFSNTLEDLYFEREKISILADIVFGFEEEIIRQLKSFSFDGVAFFDDWGTQTNLIISPELWRDFFKPRYKRQFDLAHGMGL